MKPIEDLIAASSIGVGLADIKERGIDAHLDLEQELTEIAPKKRKGKGTSPTSRTLAECKRRGWIAGVVERHIPFPKPQGTKIDLFGVIDLIAIVPPEHAPAYEDDWDQEQRTTGRQGAILAIQATGGSGGVHAARRAKILAEPRAKAWVEAGGRLELWSWSKRGGEGKRKLWTLRVETYAEMIASR